MFLDLEAYVLQIEVNYDLLQCEIMEHKAVLFDSEN